MLNVCVVGLGALGALYGFVMERSGKARVTAVCASNYEVVKDRGLNIRSERYGDIDGWKPSRVVASVDDAADRQYDFIVCATKFIPDLLPTSFILGPLLSKTSTFLLMQNGIGVHEDLWRAIPGATIISACAWVDATAIDGGKVVKHGRIDRLVLGIHLVDGLAERRPETASQERLDILVDVLSSGGCDAVPTHDIESSRWQKNLWNIGFSVFCTLSRASVATVLNDKWIATATQTVQGLMEEAVSIARATGVTVPDEAIHYAVDTTLREYAETYPPRKEISFVPGDFKPSMLVDVEADRPMEIEGIVGNVVRRGQKAGIPVPRLETVYASLLLLQEPLLQKVQNRLRT